MSQSPARAHASTVSVEIEWDAEGRRRLVMIEPIESGGEILPLEGTVRRTPTRYSIQIGEDEHLDGMGLIDATNHHCDPSAFVDFSDRDRIVLRALRDLSVSDEVSIHYCATEYDMESPFDCDCGADACIGRVRGYRYLSAKAARALESLLRPVVRAGAPPPS